MSRKLQIVLSDRYHFVLKRAAEAADCSKSEFVRDWIRDLPEWESIKNWKQEENDEYNLGTINPKDFL